MIKQSNFSFPVKKYMMFIIRGPRVAIYTAKQSSPFMWFHVRQCRTGNIGLKASYIENPTAWHEIPGVFISSGIKEAPYIPVVHIWRSKFAILDVSVWKITAYESLTSRFMRLPCMQSQVDRRCIWKCETIAQPRIQIRAHGNFL